MNGVIKCGAPNISNTKVLVKINGEENEICVETGNFLFVNIMDNHSIIPGSLTRYQNLVQDFKDDKRRHPPIRVGDRVVVEDILETPTIIYVVINPGDQRKLSD